MGRRVLEFGVHGLSFVIFVGVGLAMLFSSAFTTDASFHEILVIDLIDQIPIVLEIPA